MKAIGYTAAGPLTNPHALIERQQDAPVAGPRDLLVEVRGISVNPVDVKLRENVAPKEAMRILGFDAAGVIKKVGKDVTLFAPGDEVFYAGDITRAGTNAELHVVDERIVGKKPTSLNFAEAAGLPLTAITAWELLFDSLGIVEGGGEGEALLIIGGAGGVGSVLIQLAKTLTHLTVIASASRPETEAWVRKMGADHVVNHRMSLQDQMADIGIAPRYVASLTHTESHFPAIIELIQPRGRIALIDDPATLDVVPLKPKALSLCWEFMFARSMFSTDDMATQHALLNRVSALIDEGTLKSTVQHHAGELTLENLRRAHQMQESGKAIGKTVLGGFSHG